MFSFQFGTFESSTPGWLEWLNIAASFLGVVFSVGAAYLIFKSEQNTKDKEEVNLNEEHFNSLNDIAKIQLPLYEKQILNIDSYLNNLDDNLLLEVVVGLYNDYAKNFDLIRLVKHSKLKKLNTEEFYQFYNSIYYTSNVIDKMENEMLRYFEKSNILDDKIKSVQYGLLRNHLFEMNQLCMYNEHFRNDFGIITQEYNKLVKKVNDDERIFPKKSNELVNRYLLETEFIDKLIILIDPVVSNHPLLSEIGSNLNIFKNAINDKKNFKNVHKSTMKSYKKTLEHSVASIKKFFEM